MSDKFDPTDDESRLFSILFPSYVSFSPTILRKMRAGEYGKVRKLKNKSEDTETKQKQLSNADKNKIYQMGVEYGKKVRFWM